MAEAIEIIRGLFGSHPVTFAGKYYRITELDGQPKPVQQPLPPIMVGGGGRRVLELAGRTADIVGINPRLTADVDPLAVVADMSPDRIHEKMSWARTAALGAGRDPDGLEFQLSLFDVRVTHSGVEHISTSSLAKRAMSDALASSPTVLRGDVAACVDKLVETREKFGIAYFHVGSNLAAVAPIVARLA